MTNSNKRRVKLQNYTVNKKNEQRVYVRAVLRAESHASAPPVNFKSRIQKKDNSKLVKIAAILNDVEVTISKTKINKIVGIIEE